MTRPPRAQIFVKPYAKPSFGSTALQDGHLDYYCLERATSGTTIMSSVKLTIAVTKCFAVLLVFALSAKGVRGQNRPGRSQCQTIAFEFYAFAKPPYSLDCKQVCDKRFEAMRKMPRKKIQGVNRLSSSREKLKARADAEGIFWIDQCVAWLRYCFRQRAPMLTIDKNALDSQQSARTDTALTCLCRSVLLLVQVRKDQPEGPEFCEQQEMCGRLTGRLNLEDYGLWSCKKGEFIKPAPCGNPEPLCPCCRSRKPRLTLVVPPCSDWPEIDQLLSEPFILGDQEWLPYDLHGAPQPEEGFTRGTILEPQGPACPAAVGQEGPARFKAASLPFRTFAIDTSACGQAGLCAAESSGASQMHSHIEALSEVRERTLQLEDCVRPPQKQGIKRKAAAAADASCSISAFASIDQSQSDLISHVSQFPEAYPFPFTTLNDGELFCGPQFVSAQTTGGEGHSMHLGSGANGIDSDNLHFSQEFAESSDIDAKHATIALDPDNLQFSDYFGAAGSIPPADSSNPDDSAKETQDSLNAFDGIP